MKPLGLGSTSSELEVDYYGRLEEFVELQHPFL